MNSTNWTFSNIVFIFEPCKETGEEKTILFGLTGTGYFDLIAYQKYHDGLMSNYVPTDEQVANAAAMAEYLKK